MTIKIKRSDLKILVGLCKTEIQRKQEKHSILNYEINRTLLECGGPAGYEDERKAVVKTENQLRRLVRKLENYR